jgi:hypothetical protein
MRIPKLAFAVLMVAVVGLASAFAVVQVKARSVGSVVLLKIVWPDGDVTPCALSLVDKTETDCSSLGPVNGKSVGYRIDLIGRKGDGVELAVRTKTFGSSGGVLNSAESQKWAPRQVYFEPGHTMKLDFAGAGALTATGEWMDHMPLFLGGSTQDVQVGPEELRLVSPMLISDSRVLSDFGGSATAVKEDQGVEVYIPGEGRFILSLSPMRGAAQATVAMNRITFEEGGRTYLFVTGSPVCRGERLWVMHEVGYKPTGGQYFNAQHVFVRAGDLHQLAPESLMEGEGVKR